jgi:type IV secretory pathway VirJ component
MTALARRLALALLTALAPVVAAAAALPAVELPASGTAKPDTLAVFYSGDGGWAPIDKGVSAHLASAGVPVLGVNALSYFWTERTPDGAAADLAEAIARQKRAWGASKVLLVGYSFGASPLPLIVGRLPPAVRAEVALVVMISPDAEAELHFRPVDWIGATARDARPVADALRAIPDVPVLCLYGSREKAPACPTFGGAVRVSMLAGDHHFDGHYDAVAQTILDALRHPRG